MARRSHREDIHDGALVVGAMAMRRRGSRGGAAHASDDHNDDNESQSSSVFSISEVSHDYNFENELVEVTHAQHVRHVHKLSSPLRPSHITKRLSKLMQRPSAAAGGGGAASSASIASLAAASGVAASLHQDSQSIVSESNITNDGTIGGVTQASSETIKASNTTPGIGGGNKKKAPWKSLKSMMHLGKPESKKQAHTASSFQRQRSFEKTNGNKSLSDNAAHFLRRRTSSEAASTASNVSNKRRAHQARHPVVNTMSAAEQAMLDQSLKGRWDGIDVLSLGSAVRQTLQSNGSNNFWLASGQARQISTSDLVYDMLWTSTGRQPPEIILEGNWPDDRWSVRIETVPPPPPPPSGGRHVRSTSPTPPALSRTATDSTAEMSPTATPHQNVYLSSNSSPSQAQIAPARKLWNSLWGDPQQPRPPHSFDDDAEDPLVNCSIPIDVDEDTFLISTRDHLQAIQDICAAPLADGKFEAVLMIQDMLLKGMMAAAAVTGSTPSSAPRGTTTNSNIMTGELRFMRGSTLHNVGLLEMWQGHFDKAVHTLTQAVQERKARLPAKHTDIAVSLVRVATVYFALTQWSDAADALDEALTFYKPDSVARAKVLCLLGVVQYQQGDFGHALTSLTNALEIQRQWLDASPTIRRDTMVFDTTVTLSNMGKLYLQTSDYELACAVYEEAYMLHATLFPKDHDIVLGALTNLAVAKASNNNARKAIAILQGCWHTYKTKYGPDSGQSIDTLGLLARCYGQANRVDDALQALQTIKKWQKSHLSNRHGALRQTKAAIKEIESKQEQQQQIPVSISGWI